jgi:phenylpyruvate tautomerase PptA (4-oxalocrotonate tautomerase family)
MVIVISATRIAMLYLVLWRLTVKEFSMPLMYLHLTPNAFDAAEKRQIAELITEASLRAESIPDEPERRLRSLLFIEETPAAHFYAGGLSGESLVRGVFLHLHVGVGVMDGARRAQLIADVHAAVEQVARNGNAANDRRHVATSVVITDVPEGFWGQQGSVRRLPQMAAVAGFEHLRSVATE